MSPLVIGLVLGAALLHASWNALLKSSTDRFWMQSAICAVQGVLAAGVLLCVPMPAAASWPYVVASAVIHLVYQLLLVRTYATGDFGQTYPIARGSSPLLVAVGALLFAHEVLSPEKIAGILLVSAGILALAFEGRRFHLDRTPVALATGVSIALYTVTDGVGARLAGTAIGYIAAESVLWAILVAAVYVSVRGAKGLKTPSRIDLVSSCIGGLVAFAGYTGVVWALSVTQMGPVSALRETSVVFAAVIGRIFLRERLTVGRFAACTVIAGGGILLGL